MAEARILETIRATTSTDNINIHELSERVLLLNKSSHFEQLVRRAVGK